MKPHPAPLTPSEIISDLALRALAIPCPERASGTLNEEDTAILAMILPDLCGEMVARRAAHNTPDSSFSISNAVLHQLDKDGPRRHLGELTRREHLILSARLSSMCHELLDLRMMSTVRAA